MPNRQIHCFQTGRRYSPQGQRIAWTVTQVQLGWVTVAFYDVDRGVYGEAQLLCTLEDACDKLVLEAYDGGHYRPGIWTMVARRLKETAERFPGLPPAKVQAEFSRAGRTFVLKGIGGAPDVDYEALERPALAEAETPDGPETVTLVRTIVGAEGAYACITTTGRSLDVRLMAGRSAPDSLRWLAQEEREKADRLLRRARVMEAAADMLKP